jgi:hypothetical protein
MSPHGCRDLTHSQNYHKNPPTNTQADGKSLAVVNTRTPQPSVERQVWGAVLIPVTTLWSKIQGISILENIRRVVSQFQLACYLFAEVQVRDSLVPLGACTRLRHSDVSFIFHPICGDKSTFM